MKIKVLFGQKHGDYEGQHVPEALEVQDEYGYDANLDFLYDKISEYRKDSNFDYLNIVNINIDDEELKKILHPQEPELEGEIE